VPDFAEEVVCRYPALVIAIALLATAAREYFR
jgi:hypothetical protein